MKKLFFSLFIVIGFFMLSANTARANELATNTYPNPDTSNPDLYMTIGTGEFNIGLGVAAIIVKQPGVYTVNIEDAAFCNNDSYYSTRALDLPLSTIGSQGWFSTDFSVANENLVKKGNGSGGEASILVGYSSSCDNRDRSFNFKVTESDKDDEVNGYRVIFIASNLFTARNTAKYGSDGPGSTGTAENSFRISVNNGPAGGNPRLYFSTKNIGGSNLNNVSNRNHATTTYVNYQAQLSLKCSLTAASDAIQAQLNFYDVDNGIYQDTPAPNYQPPLEFMVEYKINEGADYENTDPPPGIPRPTMSWQGYPGYSTWIKIPGGNGGLGSPSQVFNIRFWPAVSYRVSVRGLTYRNAATFSLTSPDVTPYFADPVNCKRNHIPVAFADSCELLSDGVTTRIRGWSYDNEAGSDGPPVNIQVGNNTSVVRPTITYASARNNNIRAWIQARESSFGTEAFDGVYGWEKTYTNLDPDENYAISGTVYDAGGDRNQDLRINGWNSTTNTDVNGVFPQGRLPSSCLPSPVDNPVGFLDSCTLTFSGGVYTTTLRGWAYDNDASPRDGKPRVTINVSGRDPKTVDSDIEGYYSGRVEAWLDSKGYGNSVRDNVYGWEAKYNNLDTGGSYSVSGTVIDVGPAGVNKPLRINGYNVATQADANNFPNLRIPANCLPPPEAPVRCEGDEVTFDKKEMMEQGTLSVTIRHGSSSAAANINVTSVTFEAIADMELSGAVTPSLPRNVAKGNTQAFSRQAKFNKAKAYNIRVVINYTDPAPQTITCQNEITVYNRPYLKAFGGDVWVGGKFGALDGDCNSGKSIYALTSGSGANVAGSSGQFGVTALMNIETFYSSSQRRTLGLNLPPKGTTFANTAATGTFGGQYGAGLCTTDYFSTRDPDLGATAFNGDFADRSGIRQYYNNAAKLVLSAPITVPRGYQSAVFVDGRDVHINGNISYGTGARTSVKDIPFFAIIVRGGNIYIDESVTNIDGLFIAQATGSSNGRIYTCSNVNGTNVTLHSTGNGENYAQCNRKLTINGALYANRIRFLRNKTTVGQAGTFSPIEDTDNVNGAAELINFNPELYLAPSPLSDNTSSDRVDPYESIFTLPPVF